MYQIYRLSCKCTFGTGEDPNAFIFSFVTLKFSAHIASNCLRTVGSGHHNKDIGAGAVSVGKVLEDDGPPDEEGDVDGREEAEEDEEGLVGGPVVGRGGALHAGARALAATGGRAAPLDDTDSGLLYSFSNCT